MNTITIEVRSILLARSTPMWQGCPSNCDSSRLVSAQAFQSRIENNASSLPIHIFSNLVRAELSCDASLRACFMMDRTASGITDVPHDGLAFRHVASSH